MAFVDDPNQKSENVAGAAPLSQPTATPQAQGESAPTQGDSSPSTIQSGSTAPKTTNKSGKAGSGMFTNIQNYVAKNQPQGQKMAENTLGEIRKANEASKEAQKNALSQFSSQTEQGGLHDTAARQAEVDAYTRSQANIVTPPPEAAPQADAAPVDVTPAPQTGIDESQFANILNAQYQGPRNLTETGNIYSQLQNQATKSADMGKLTQTAEGRGQLLKDINTRGGRQYGAGMSKLDSMLVGQQPNQIEALMKEGSDIGTSQDIMGRLSQQSKDVAGQRASEVQATRDASRETFGTVASERQQEVDARVDDVVANWDNLPDHYKGIFSKPDGSVDLSAIEAATLGMDDSTRLFNLRDQYGVDELFGGVDADKTKLISSDEQANLARMQALSNLATGMPEGEKLYDIGDYFDESKAGTQSAFDALNLGNFADKLESTEQDFQRDIDKTQTGKGHKKVSRGNAWGKKTKNYYATAQDNLANQLSAQQDNAVSQIMASNPDISQEDAQAAAQNMGYGYKAGEVERLNTNPDLLANLAELSKDYNISSENGKLNLDTSSMNELQEGGELDMSDAGAALSPAGILAREGVLGDIGSDLYGTARNFINAPGEMYSNVGDSLKDSDILGDFSQIAGNAFSELGQGFGNIVNSVGGIDTGAMKKFGSGIAQNQANTNLLNKLKSEQSRLGASNVARVADTEETNQRTNALLDILKNLDTTNK
jgi:hypothetical protein